MSGNKNKFGTIYITMILILGFLCIIGAAMSFLTLRANSKLHKQLVQLQTENEQLNQELQLLVEKYEKPSQDELIAEIENLEPGTIVDVKAANENLEYFFSARKIEKGDAVYERINGKSYKDNPNVALSDLRYIKVLHYNFDHKLQVGELIVNVDVTEDVLNIFKELFNIEYEVQSMYLIDNYWTGDGGTSDTASIDKNNTSAFCYRVVTGGGGLSNHAYGRAIDINPQQNPYVYLSGGEWVWSHSNADPYIDRTTGDPHVIVNGDPCYNIFAKYGFSWGGNWENPKDYQHFEKTR